MFTQLRGLAVGHWRQSDGLQGAPVGLLQPWMKVTASVIDTQKPELVLLLQGGTCLYAGFVQPLYEPEKQFLWDMLGNGRLPFLCACYKYIQCGVKFSD